MYTSSTIMNFISEGKICFTETGWKCKTSLSHFLETGTEFLLVLVRLWQYFIAIVTIC